jgi:capsular polysaccharide biosynthesis protein
MPFGPITSKNLSYAFALMVGLVGGAGSGFLREFFDDSVKTAADVTSTTALPVLASIPEETRRGKKNGGTTRFS